MAESFEKTIYDPIHGYIHMSGNCLNIIDSVYFKRLQNIKQTGLLYHVFPGATHTRFEHSLGVAYLGEKLMVNLMHKQPHLKITPRMIEMVKIAGLCHDMGHGPFSHMFDNLFIGDNKNIENKEHEKRSCNMVRMLRDKGYIDLDDIELNCVCEMINPQNKHTQGFYLYEIIANKTHGIDVDKFDYLLRDAYHIGLDHHFDSSRFLDCAKVINDRLCYNKSCIPIMRNLFNLRYNLYMNIYNHHAAKAIEYMVFDMMKLIDKWEGISNIIDTDRFWTLDDNIIDQALYTYRKNIIKNVEYERDMDRVAHIWHRLRERDLYKSYYNMADPKGKYIDHYIQIDRGDSQITKVPIYDKDDKIYYINDVESPNKVLTIIKD